MAKASKSDLVNQKKDKSVSKTSAFGKTTTAAGGSGVKVVNPFDRKVNKVKHEVLGKKIVGGEGNRGQSRYNAFEKRKKTLGIELKLQGKTNKFVDQRYGESDETMTEEERMLVRFQKEKMRNKNQYNLDDDAEELTHMGQSLGDKLIEDYQPDSDDQGSDDEMGKEFLDERTRFGGGDDDDENRKRSTKDIYQEIIEKSKAGKAERAREKLIKERLTNELDADFEAIRGELVLSSKVQATPAQEDDEFLKFQAEQQKANAVNSSASGANGVEKEKHDDFDELLVSLAGEAKARATDRLKTADEIFKEEKEKLEKLEQERLKRMKGDDVDFDDDQEIEPDSNRPDRLKKRKRENDNRPKILSADSLDECDEILKANGVEPAMYNPSLSSDEEGDDDEEGDEDEDDEEEEGDEDEDEDDDDEDEDEDLEDDEENDSDESEEEKEKVIKKKSTTTQEIDLEIPYTFEIPSSIQELNEWLENRNNEQKELILTRIRVCNHVSIKPQNKEKMIKYLPILYQRFIETAQGEQTQESVVTIDWKEIDILNRHIFEVSQDVPLASGSSAKEILDRAFKRITKKLEVSSKVNYWPTVDELLFFKLLGNVFPTSDFQHTVLTPATESLNLFLSSCPLRNSVDIVSSLFVSNILFFYLSSAKRYSPEITSLISSLLNTFVNHNPTLVSQPVNKKSKSTPTTTTSQWASIQSNFLPTILLPNDLLQIQSKDKKSPIKKMTPSEQLDFSILFKKPEDTYLISNQFKIDLLNYLLNFISKYIGFYSESEFKESLPTVFKHFVDILGRLNIDNDVIKTKVKDLVELINAKITEITSERVPLTLLTNRPAPLKQFNPRFNQVYTPYDKDPDQLRAEAKKMKGLVKKEMRGAMREVIKDNYFIQSEKFNKAQMERKENEAATKRVMSQLQNEQAEYKQYKKTKDRLDGRI
ncbi:hypothetical protein CYY_001441 [Polysphondylium violaceum]|uniref:U3 snoRNP protein n=1 Tax=Polysphondylium violaceum TaxID=133409 RepID=A0A8J4V7X4_9MYCE|nr:hypothetical protein CYY_001441 [Polysphondylium violaceum]